jgi:large subunit ribosomal protein L10
VAVVTEVRARLDAAEAAILTEYRGLTVAELAALRTALRAAGGDYKIYKNTLVKLAVAGGRHEALAPLLQGPTAITFVSGEVSAAAKALRDSARTYPNLVIKGGLHGEGFLSAQELNALADLPPRDVLLAQLAGAIAAPLRQFAGLLQALPRNLAYGLSALVDQRGGVPAEATAVPTETAGGAEPEAPVEANKPAEGPVEVSPEAEMAAPEAPVEAEAESEAPAVAEEVGETEPPAVTETAPAETEAAQAETEAVAETEAPPEG